MFIDDNPDGQRLRVLEFGDRATVRCVSPQEITRSVLDAADVVLVDYKLDDWPERDAVPAIALNPVDGIALAAVIRSYLSAHERLRRPRAFAVHSAHLDDIVSAPTWPLAAHRVARSLNLEWAFAKSGYRDGATELADQVLSLADAIAAVRSPWPEDGAKGIARAMKLLVLPSGEDLSDRAQADVELCRPPAHGWSAATHGMAVVRWMLHQILPFPTFLWDTRYLATRLRVSTVSLTQILGDARRARRIRRALSPAAYGGILSGFDGERWWRVGIEQLLWQWTAGRPFDRTALRTAVSKHLSPDLEHLSEIRPVVCLDHAQRPSNSVVNIENAVQVIPDDWPAFAEPAYVAKEDVEGDDDLRALVQLRDQRRLDSIAGYGTPRSLA